MSSCMAEIVHKLNSWAEMEPAWATDDASQFQAVASTYMCSSLAREPRIVYISKKDFMVILFSHSKLNRVIPDVPNLTLLC